MVKWTNNKAEIDLESKIAKRAIALAAKHDIELKQIDIMMDIDACHCNGCPLKLVELLNASDFDFSHDVLGIRRHINRETGELIDCFLPRYAV
jgi:hypothetical protein